MGIPKFLVGSNGTEEILFAEKLHKEFRTNGLKPRLLSSERLAGLEKRNYDEFGFSQLAQGYNIGAIPTYKKRGKEYGLVADAIVLLKEKLELKIKIEATLSQLFGR